MRRNDVYNSGTMKGLISFPDKKPESIIVALHGIGSNERELVSVAIAIAPDSLVVSLRSPIELAQNSYSFFHVQFTPTGPVHDWYEAKKNFELLERELQYLSTQYDIPLNKMTVMGFSQGSIMTMGLLLQSKLDIGHYVCFSGRTLPEFSDFAKLHPEIGRNRKVFLAHGTQDNTLPVALAHRSKDVLEGINAKLTYKEFEGGHGVSEETLNEVREWLSMI